MSEAFEQPKGAMSCISYKNFELHVTGFLGFLVSYVSIAMLACKLSHQTWQTYQNISLTVLTLTLDVLEMHYSLLGQIHVSFSNLKKSYFHRMNRIQLGFKGLPAHVLENSVRAETFQNLR